MVVLANAGVIQPVDPRASIYRFRHALMRDAAYETQVLDVRAQTHAQRRRSAPGARGGTGSGGRAPGPGRGRRGAADQYVLAAQAEQSRGAHTEAAELLTRALDLLETLPESQERDLSELTGRMLRALSVLSMQGYAAPDVESDHRRAEVLAKRLGSRPEVLPSLIAIWAYCFARGELGTARALIDRLMGMVARHPSPGSSRRWPRARDGRRSSRGLG